MKNRYWQILATILASLFTLSCLASSLAVSTPTILAPTLTKSVPVSTKAPTDTGVWTSTIVRPLVNVRKSPNGVVVDTLRTGVEVEIVQCAGNWCQIVDPPGYVWRGCLSDNPQKLGCAAK